MRLSAGWRIVLLGVAIVLGGAAFAAYEFVHAAKHCLTIDRTC